MDAGTREDDCIAVPHKPRTPCKHRNCPALVQPGETYCEKHKEAHRNDYARAHPGWFKLYNTKRWRRYRRMFLSEHPVCEECGHAATDVDHIEDHMGDWDKFWDESNHQALCHSCH